MKRNEVSRWIHALKSIMYEALLILFAELFQFILAIFDLFLLGLAFLALKIIKKYGLKETLQMQKKGKILNGRKNN